MIFLFPENVCPSCFGEIDIETGSCLVCVVREIHEERKIKNSLRRKNTNKVISKRLEIVKNVWQDHDHPYLHEPGRLEKYNLSCNCKMCKHEKIFDKEKPKYQLQDDVWGEICEYKGDIYEL